MLFLSEGLGALLLSIGPYFFLDMGPLCIPAMVVHCECCKPAAFNPTTFVVDTGYTFSNAPSLFVLIMCLPVGWVCLCMCLQCVRKVMGNVKLVQAF